MRQSASVIEVGVMYVGIMHVLKEELALATDKML